MGDFKLKTKKYAVWLALFFALTVTSLVSAAEPVAVSEVADKADLVQKSQQSANRLLGLGYSALIANDFDNARTLLEKAYKLSPSNGYVTLNLGVVYQKTGQFDKARVMYHETIENAAPSKEAAIASQRGWIGKSLVDIAQHNLKSIESKTNKLGA